MSKTDGELCLKGVRFVLYTGAILVLALSLALAGGCRLFRRPALAEEEPTIRVRTADSLEKLKLEEYIAGVVAGEMDSHWPIEALGAQAIIARTFTLKKVFDGGGFENFVASTDEKELQAYSADDITDNVREAVRRTRGVVATYNGAVIMTWFHSCSGGMTTTPDIGLNFDDEPTPYIKPVEDDFPCDGRDTWQATFASEEIITTAGEFGIDPGEVVRSMEIKEKGPRGRAVTLLINGSSVNAADFRVRLDPKRMCSTWLTELKVQDGQVAMAGRGFGHGVGMSQFGAKAQAARGKTASEIIQYYYRDIQLEKRWE